MTEPETMCAHTMAYRSSARLRYQGDIVKVRAYKGEEYMAGQAIPSLDNLQKGHATIGILLNLGSNGS